MKSIFQKLGDSRFRDRDFFEKVWIISIALMIIQLCAQWYSFDSETEYILNAVIMPDASLAHLKTYALALIFELLKAFVIAAAFAAFFKGELGFIAPALIGIVLSVGSWWMSDQGTSYMAEVVAGNPPVNTETTTLSGIFQPQINKIDQEINALEEKNFYWCKTHGARHKCDDPNNKEYINPNEKSDRLAVTRITQLKAKRDAVTEQMNGQLLTASEQHSAALNEHQRNKKRLHTSLEYKVLFAEIITWICMYFNNYVLFVMYSAKTPEEEQNEDNTSPTPPDNRTKKKTPASTAAPTYVNKNGTLVNGNPSQNGTPSNNNKASHGKQTPSVSGNQQSVPADHNTDTHTECVLAQNSDYALRKADYTDSVLTHTQENTVHTESVYNSGTVLNLDVSEETEQVKEVTKIRHLDVSTHKGYDITCEHCGTKARKKTKHAKYCSKECRYEHNNLKAKA